MPYRFLAQPQATPKICSNSGPQVCPKYNDVGKQIVRVSPLTVWSGICLPFTPLQRRNYSHSNLSPKKPFRANLRCLRKTGHSLQLVGHLVPHATSCLVGSLWGCYGTFLGTRSKSAQLAQNERLETAEHPEAGFGKPGGGWRAGSHPARPGFFDRKKVSHMACPPKPPTKGLVSHKTPAKWKNPVSLPVGSLRNSKQTKNGGSKKRHAQNGALRTACSLCESIGEDLPSRWDGLNPGMLPLS